MKKIELESKIESWEIGNEYEIIKQIGCGSYGAVCEAVHKKTGTRVAIKKVVGVFMDPIDGKRILREMQLLRLLKNSKSNVVKLYEILEPADPNNFCCLYLVMEYAQADLKKLIKAGVQLQQVHVEKIIYNILVGLKYVHSAGVLHRDIKPANVLINEDCSVRICDFGLARSIVGIEGPSISLMDKNLLMEEVSMEPEHEEAKATPPLLANINCEEMKDVQSSPAEGQEEEDKKKIMHKKILGIKEKRKRLKRQLTGHVATRWYRAPEIILLEKDYSPAIDVWSVGCIFGELLSVLVDNGATGPERHPLFPGTSCFPLSPAAKVTAKRNGFPYSQTDQLNMIFDVLGSPTEEECSFVTDAKALEYLKAFALRKRIDFSERYKAAKPEAIDFLNKLLVFNPFFRLTIEECLNHPYLAPVKDLSQEIVATQPVKLHFESEGLQDEDRLKELFWGEIMYYKQLRDKGQLLFT